MSVIILHSSILHFLSAFAWANLSFFDWHEMYNLMFPRIFRRVFRNVLTLLHEKKLGCVPSLCAARKGSPIINSIASSMRIFEVTTPVK